MSRLPTAPESWASRHFSLSNAVGPGQDDLPMLLRRTADAIEGRRLQADDILDLVISSDVTADGKWWSTTLYVAGPDSSPDGPS